VTGVLATLGQRLSRLPPFLLSPLFGVPFPSYCGRRRRAPRRVSVRLRRWPLL